MKKQIFSLIVLFGLLIMAAPNANAGIPISENAATVLSTPTEEVSQVPVIKKTTRKELRQQKKMVRRAAAAAGGKSQIVALLLCFFLGWIGVHRFYLGYTWQGIVQLLFGWNLLAIWVLIDFIRIILGNLEPKDGPYDKTF